MSGTSRETEPKKSKNWSWISLVGSLIGGGLCAFLYLDIDILDRVDNRIDNSVDNSVAETKMIIDQAIGELDTKIENNLTQIFNEAAASRVEPIAIEGWLVLETGDEYYRVVLDESPASPMTTMTQLPTVTTTTVPERLPRPRIRDYRNQLETNGCQGVPGSDQWCFYSGGAASYLAWRLNSINFRGPDVFANMYGLDELSDGPTVWGHPRDWARTARALGIQVDDVPARGAVAQWGGDTDGDYGFVAYVEEVASDADEADSGEDSGITIVLSYMNLDGEAVPTDPTSWTLREGTRCSPDSCGPRGWPDNFIHIRALRGPANRRQPMHKEPAIPRHLDVEAHLFARALS